MGKLTRIRKLLSGNQNQRQIYPITVSARDFGLEPPGIGVEIFDTPEATELNQARLAHLDWLGLQISGKSVLDVGCGVGHLAQYFVTRNCNVVCTDARTDNINRLKALYPILQSRVMDIESDVFGPSEQYQIVFCFGLLYHLENPFRALRKMTSVCKELLILETLICDHEKPLVVIDAESKAFNQAIAGSGCRPTPSYVVFALNMCGFKYIYAPSEPPHHPDFQFEWRNNLDILRNRRSMRCVFIGSREKLDNPKLVELL